MADTDFPTTWRVPAITAGTPEVRQWERLYGNTHREPPEALRVDNHDGDASLTLFVNGETFRVGPGAVITVERADMRGPPLVYMLDANSNTSVGDVRVYEIYDLEDED